MLRRAASALVVIAAATHSAAGQRAASDSVPAKRWEILADVRGGVPTGFVQVRENAVAGTRLDFRNSLAIHSLWAAAVEVDWLPDARTRISFAVTSVSLWGESVPSHDVYFNGTTLAAGSRLVTSTEFPNFVAATITGSRRIAGIGKGVLSGTAGVSFVVLEFVLEGTLAPSSATRETKEDFYAQELPVPELGLDYRAPIGSRWQVDLSLTGGWLPWVNSLRKEGGTVTITQTAAQFTAESRYAVTPTFGVTGALRLSSFAQDEQSTEDGNVISMRTATVGIGLAQRF